LSDIRRIAAILLTDQNDFMRRTVGLMTITWPNTVRALELGQTVSPQDALTALVLPALG
jgi:hypothetical protein